MAKPEKQQKKKKVSFWISGAATRVYLVLGIPAFALLAWYGYTVASELNKPAMTEFEDKLAQKMNKLMEKKVTLKHYDACENMMEEYITPKGWNYSAAALHELVGLPKNSTEQQLEDRCIYYAKVVNGMERLSHHTRHVFVCKGSYLDVGKSGKQYIKADRKGRGAMVSVTGKEELLPITPGESTIFKFWQVYNVGDGCIIIGLSKSGVFRMAGQVIRKIEDSQIKEGEKADKKEKR